METETKTKETKAGDSGMPETYVPATSRPMQVGFWDYAKYAVKPVAAHVLTGNILGYVAAKMAPPAASIKLFSESTLSRMKQLRLVTPEGKWHVFVVSQITGILGGIYANYILWKRIQGRQVGIKDIREDAIKVLEPGEAEAQLEQNQRIQDGIAQIVAKGTSASHAEAALKDSGGQKITQR